MFVLIFHGIVSLQCCVSFCRTANYDLSHVPLFETPWTVACQAPLCLGFPRQEYWSVLPFPFPEDEMIGWHHRLDGHEFEQAMGVGDGQGGLACCSPRGHKELTQLSN